VVFADAVQNFGPNLDDRNDKAVSRQQPVAINAQG
jgi:hypothetical protein